MRQALKMTCSAVDHHHDAALWMRLFPALLRAGYTWHEDDIIEWLQQHWRGETPETSLTTRGALTVRAWALMAKYQADHDPYEGDEMVERLSALCKGEQGS